MVQLKIRLYKVLVITLVSVLFVRWDTAICQSKGYSSWLPAPTFDDAMLLGNGTMGAMVLGHPQDETIIINHSSLYLPTSLPKQPIDQAGLLDDIRSLLLEGKGTEAAKLPVEQSMKEGYGGLVWSDPYIPAFDLRIKSSLANIDNYKRSLNFETGEAVVKWSQGGNDFVRKQFISRTDSVMVVNMAAQQPFEAKFYLEQRPVIWNQKDYVNSNVQNVKSYAKENEVFYESEFTHQWKGNIGSYAGVGKVLSTDGNVSAKGNTLTIKDATYILFLLKVEPFLTGKRINTDDILADLNKVPANYDVLLDNHVKVHSELFNRVTFNIAPDSADDIPDTEVMMLQAKEKNQKKFIEELFYAARYNIICATGKTPPNLQGIWGSSWQPPWASDYTHDGNLPVAISSFLISDLPELMMSYFDYHDARLSYYRDNAKKLYNCRGIQIPSHTSSQGWNNHFNETWCLTFWNGAAPWAAHYYYDYWLYTNDKTFLEERAYPFMKETALFFEDFLTIGTDGKYIFNPSYSPENNPSNYPSQATLNATMDVMLVNELLRNLIEAGKVLGEDKKQLEKWNNMLGRMPAYELDSAGVLREWLWPGYEENHSHRHISQLYGLYYMVDPQIASDSALLKGARKAVEERMKVRRQEGGGIMVFGMVQMAWVASNLGDIGMVSEIINWLSSQYWSNSLASFHDPNGLFNMDLSGGYQTVILRTLINSYPGELEIFPAKPIDWKEGNVTGVKARGQITIQSLMWQPDHIKLNIISAKKQQIKIKIPQHWSSFEVVNKGAKLKSYSELTGIAVLDVKPDVAVEVSIK